MALHALVELVLPRGQAGLGAAQRNRLDRTRALMELLGFRCLVQEPERAFAVNRLLLPLQIFALDCLRAVWPAATVDEASASPCLPLRHLGAMDAIGLELVCAAAANYRRGPAAVDPAGVDRLVAGLGELLALGKRGARNRDGLLMGQPLPWQLAELAGDVVALAARFAALAETTLRQALASGDFTRDELAFVLDELWGGRLP